ncbi:MAG TPA: ribonuclease HI family protein [Candidatus Portnoybacteria bacterium]|jgi:ribonuclease HI|nr:ribonuclease HI family protein [Candidatus Portnoybacteria bacterium]MDD5751925.1 ribonuclease HI family protein [Candidatus Portnoybacteria bacterium]HNU96686.1 ribonuclease HI family protein [Candidatus Portnoybacteria bacterium]HOZ16271.1 ribonuclease HI family protein [Candidatus Portnoybacteria bacterium]HPH51933.1 ribonuclease HI family protein [Candidatus Portnoybacteria bacterium]
MKIIIYTDGGSRGNPGPAGIGVVFCDEKGKVIKEYGEKIGRATNNEAEYEAVIFALQKAKLLFGGKKAKIMDVEIRTDSEFLAKQMNGKYKILDRKIEQLFLKVWNLKIDFNRVEFIHIPRHKNFDADKLVNQALDSKEKESKSLPGI